MNLKQMQVRKTKKISMNGKSKDTLENNKKIRKRLTTKKQKENGRKKNNKRFRNRKIKRSKHRNKGSKKLLKKKSIRRRMEII